MRLWWRKAEGTEQTPAAPKAKAKAKPVAGMAGWMAISTEDGLQHPLAPRNLKPHDELSESNDG
jgi:hypothetical protein